jgi:hypothetical protein
MAVVVWITMAMAIWHFTVFLPDKFWSGIVGALIGAVAGGMVLGAAMQLAASKSLGETDIGTVLIAVPGAMIGMAIVYAIGARQEARAAASPGAGAS